MTWNRSGGLWEHRRQSQKTGIKIDYIWGLSVGYDQGKLAFQCVPLRILFYSTSKFMKKLYDAIIYVFLSFLIGY